MTQSDTDDLSAAGRIKELERLLRGSHFVIGKLLCCIEPDTDTNKKARGLGLSTRDAITSLLKGKS